MAGGCQRVSRYSSVDDTEVDIPVRIVSVPFSLPQCIPLSLGCLKMTDDHCQTDMMLQFGLLTPPACLGTYPLACVPCLLCGGVGTQGETHW